MGQLVGPGFGGKPWPEWSLPHVIWKSGEGIVSVALEKNQHVHPHQIWEGSILQKQEKPLLDSGPQFANLKMGGGGVDQVLCVG